MNGHEDIPLTVDRPNKVQRYILVKVAKVIVESVMEWMRREGGNEEGRPWGIEVEHGGTDPKELLKELDGSPQVYEEVVSRLVDDLERSGCITTDDGCHESPIEVDNPIVRFDVDSGFSAILGIGTAGEVSIRLTDFHGYIIKCVPRVEP